MTLLLRLEQICLLYKPSTDLQGLRIQMTVQTLFTAISSKTCTEHVRNLIKPLPSILLTVNVLKKVFKESPDQRGIDI